MNLNTYEWKEFKIPSLFDVCPGKYYSKDSYDEGKTPYISASDTHNGISSMTNLEPDFTGNKMTIGKIGATAYYQSQPFCATSDVNVLTPKFKMSPFVGLFISRIINYSENYKWSYGRQCRVGDTNKIAIKLPIKYRLLDGGKTKEPIIDESHKYSDKGYIPDWQFMEDYIKSLHHKPLSTKNKQNPHSLEIDKWKEFQVKDILDIYNGKGITQQEIEDNPGNFVVVQSGAENNGVLGYIDFDYCKSKGYTYDTEMCLTVARSGSAGYVSFQKNGCVVGDSAKILKLKFNPSIYIYLFIKTILMANKYKYTYGRKVTEDKYLDLIIKLPVKYKDKQNEDDKEEIIYDNTHKYSPKGYIPDWDFMENYIKSLPYGDKL